MTRAITLLDASGQEVQKTKKRRDVEALQRERYSKTLAALKRWGTRLKRAKTEVKKLERQRRYYERALDAAKE